MATLTVQQIDQNGLAPSYATAAGGGDKALPGANVFLHVVNDSADTGLTLTMTTPGTVKGNAIADPTFTVAFGTDLMIPLDPDLYANRADSGLAAWTYSAATDITVAVIAR